MNVRQIGNATLYCGNSLEVLPTLDAQTIDAVVTDPPAGISFMGKEWDDFRRSRNPNDAGRDSVFGRTSQHGPEYSRGDRENFITWLSSILTECYRVAKPGANILCWSIPRTSHWTGMALEDAGWFPYDVISHIQGQGFPKSANISKMMDKKAGAEREIIGIKPNLPGLHRSRSAANHFTDDNWQGSDETARQITAPATPLAAQWEGYGTSLKPAVEMWWLARKPYENTYADNAEKWGVAGINIDGTRIGVMGGMTKHTKSDGDDRDRWEGNTTTGVWTQNGGRWPSNVCFSHDERCVKVGTKKVKNLGGVPSAMSSKLSQPAFTSLDETSTVHYFDENGDEEVDEWQCVDDCPVRLLDEQSGDLHDRGNINEGVHIRSSGVLYCNNMISSNNPHLTKHDTGGASRFFYQAKSSRSEREAGLIHYLPCIKCGDKDSTTHINDKGIVEKCIRNNHPTVKSLGLMEYLVILVSMPSGSLILDPFMGSGSTIVAALQKGQRVIGIEQDEKSFEIACRRAEYAQERIVQRSLLD